MRTSKNQLWPHHCISGSYQPGRSKGGILPFGIFSAQWWDIGHVPGPRSVQGGVSFFLADCTALQESVVNPAKGLSQCGGWKQTKRQLSFYPKKCHTLPFWIGTEVLIHNAKCHSTTMARHELAGRCWVFFNTFNVKIFTIFCSCIAYFLTGWVVRSTNSYSRSFQKCLVWSECRILNKITSLSTSKT